jgi:hypothetical protein
MRSARRTEEKQTVQGKNKVGKDSSSLTRPFKIPRLKETAKTSIKVAKETFAKIYQEKDKDIANDDRSDSEEEDSVPISQLLGADKEKVRGHRKDNSEWGKRMEKELGRVEKRQQNTAETSSPNVINGKVMTRSDEERIPILFEKGHSNLGRDCAKFFEAVLHYGNVTEVIPRRKGYYYKITYEDGDQEDMDDAELIFAIQLKHKKTRGRKFKMRLKY